MLVKYVLPKEENYNCWRFWRQSWNRSSCWNHQKTKSLKPLPISIKKKLQERLAKLSGGVAVIEIGAATEVEIEDKKLRIEDALNATRAAVEEGIVAGGGTTFIDIQPALENIEAEGDVKTGVEIVKRAIEEPLRQIVANAGKEGAVVVQKVREGKADFGYNARTDVYENLHAAGVVDPAKVTRVLLRMPLLLQACSWLQNV